jgi:hypothetical protein
MKRTADQLDLSKPTADEQARREEERNRLIDDLAMLIVRYHRRRQINSSEQEKPFGSHDLNRGRNELANLRLDH